MAESIVPPSLQRLRVGALATTGLMLVQLALGITLASGVEAVRDIHGGVGYLTLLAAAVTAVFAWPATKVIGSKGIFFHAVSLPVLMVVQIGLAEMDLPLVHIVLGLLLVAGVAGLVPMVAKQVAKASVDA
ncbi:hypothetical protein [Raineyella sp.]|uniref:Uncharacterized protein n=1 Tax=bioreactor metagenome TaxID=1076179 RepID=A0A644ZF84_9ZZZZ|nr:hypothetical protein [Raineyella sp.]MEA5155839.1 hypothetical protein [Raineyella sp.]